MCASVIVYAFDRRRFDFTNELTNSSIPQEGSTNTNKIPQLLTDKYPRLKEAHESRAAGLIDDVTMTVFESADILLEYFHDTDQDALEIVFAEQNTVCDVYGI